MTLCFWPSESNTVDTLEPLKVAGLSLSNATAGATQPEDRLPLYASVLLALAATWPVGTWMSPSAPSVPAGAPSTAA
ncbi:hypothetical protein D3C72_2251970 [compost metagenome]